jgi:hypothetical protein
VARSLATDPDPQRLSRRGDEERRLRVAVDIRVEEVGLEETRDSSTLESALSSAPSCAGFLKIACEDSLEKSPLPLIEAAVGASSKPGQPSCHTEKGRMRADCGGDVPSGSPERLVLCYG